MVEQKGPKRYQQVITRPLNEEEEETVAIELKKEYPDFIYDDKLTKIMTEMSYDEEFKPFAFAVDKERQTLQKAAEKSIKTTSDDEQREVEAKEFVGKILEHPQRGLMTFMLYRLLRLSLKLRRLEWVKVLIDDLAIDLT